MRPHAGDAALFHRFTAMNPKFPVHKRVDRDRAALLLLDFQSGIINFMHDSNPSDLKNSVMALAACGKHFNLPTILSTNFETGPNGPIAPELTEIFPDAPYIARPGEFNPWDHPAFVKAVRATKREQLIIAGVPSDIAPTFAALSAIENGYEVFLVTDACAATDSMSRKNAFYRTYAAGAQLMSWIAIACDLQRNWQEDIEGFGMLFSSHIPNFRFMLHSYQSHHTSGSESEKRKSAMRLHN